MKKLFLVFALILLTGAGCEVKQQAEQPVQKTETPIVNEIPPSSVPEEPVSANKNEESADLKINTNTKANTNVNTAAPAPTPTPVPQTAQPTTPVVEEKAALPEEKPATTPATEEKSMTRGTFDSDFVLETYDKIKAQDGTTLLADNHNTDKPRIIEVNMLGEIIWEYDLPAELKRYTNPGLDAEVLANNNILFVLPGNGVYEVNRNKNIVWSYKTTKISHDADRLANGNTLFVFGNNDTINDPQVTEVNPAGQVVWSWYAKDYYNKAPYASIKDQGWTHTNAVTRLSNGNTLISTRNFNMVVEVNPQGEVVKTIGEGIMAEQHDPVLLANGDYLFANHTVPEKAVEINSAGSIIWEYAVTSAQQWPVRDANRLSNGNTLVTTTTKIIEVTPAKEIVWSFAIKDTSKFVGTVSAGLGFYKAERIKN